MADSITRGLTYESCLRYHKTSRSSQVPTRILKVYINLIEFSHTFSLGGLLTPSRLYPWKSSGYGNGGWKVHSKDKGEVRSFLLPEASSRVNWRSRSLDDLLQQRGTESLLVLIANPSDLKL